MLLFLKGLLVNLRTPTALVPNTIKHKLVKIRPLGQISSKTELHHLLSVVVVIAHASEIGNVVSHLGWFDLALAVTVFTLWQASAPQKEKEI